MSSARVSHESKAGAQKDTTVSLFFFLKRKATRNRTCGHVADWVGDERRSGRVARPGHVVAGACTCRPWWPWSPRSRWRGRHGPSSRHGQPRGRLVQTSDRASRRPTQLRAWTRPSLRLRGRREGHTACLRAAWVWPTNQRRGGSPPPVLCASCVVLAGVEWYRLLT